MPLSDARRITGLSNLEVMPANVPTVPGRLFCSYNVPPPSAQMVYVSVSTGPDYSGWPGNLKTAVGGDYRDAEALSGLGKQAYWSPKGQSLGIDTGSAGVIAGVALKAPEAKAWATGIARTVLSHL